MTFDSRYRGLPRGASLVALLLTACAAPRTSVPKKPELSDVSVTDAYPASWVPGTVVTVEGDGFVPDIGGSTVVHLDGTIDSFVVDVELPARFVDYGRIEVDWPGLDALGIRGEGTFEGSISVVVDAVHDGRIHRSKDRNARFQLVDVLQPGLDTSSAEAAFLNDEWVLEGRAFLAGGAEGDAVLEVSGCFEPRGGGGACDPVGPVRVVGLASADRDRLTVPFSPDLAGIERGDFVGTGTLINVHADGTEREGGSVELSGAIGAPILTGLSPLEASLGQYVAVEGRGFVGPTNGDSTAVTLVELQGSLGGGGSVAVTLVPEFQDGELVRYVLNEEDALGGLIDLRSAGDSFSGTARPVVAWGPSEVEGDAVPVAFEVAPVKQVVYVRFLPNFYESLRHFGMFSAREAITDRIIEVVERDYAGVNLELRLEAPEDYALYSVVEVSGPDPNGLGLLGYDNTPGKDVGNQRLYDTIGGVNALTQQDGYPGFGGVFIESLFSFSSDPGGFAVAAEVDPLFDQLFDPFRPDRDGRPMGEAEVADRSVPSANTDCPASGREARVGCAVFALGNLVGTTLSHEIAHSLGLADPEGEAFHNTGDWEDALMDGGSYRTFAERAEVGGEGPGLFCQGAFDYLQDILPTGEGDPVEGREDCY